MEDVSEKMSKDKVYRLILLLMYIGFIFAVCYSPLFQTIIVIVTLIAVTSLVYKLIK